MMRLPDPQPGSPSDVSVRSWTRKEYLRIADAGVFGDSRVELIDGIIYEMNKPQSPPHAVALDKGRIALQKIFTPGFHVRPFFPLILGRRSMPQPDLAIVAGEPDDYMHRHPSKAVLVVEVTELSQFHDRERKARLYCRAKIQEYWILNLRYDLIEVLRDPTQTKYRSRRVCRRGETISPVARPEASVAVDDLLPRHEPAS